MSDEHCSTNENRQPWAARSAGSTPAPPNRGWLLPANDRLNWCPPFCSQAAGEPGHGLRRLASGARGEINVLVGVYWLVPITSVTSRAVRLPSAATSKPGQPHRKPPLPREGFGGAGGNRTPVRNASSSRSLHDHSAMLSERAGSSDLCAKWRLTRRSGACKPRT